MYWNSDISGIKMHVFAYGLSSSEYVTLKSLDWSSDGCKEVQDGDKIGNGVICRCNHLTTFGVLVVS